MNRLTDLQGYLLDADKALQSALDASRRAEDKYSVVLDLEEAQRLVQDAIERSKEEL